MNTTTHALRLPADAAPGNPQSAIRNLQSNIARLPKATRDMLNVMLDDSLPYHVILDELGEAAQGLTVVTSSEVRAWGRIFSLNVDTAYSPAARLAQD